MTYIQNKTRVSYIIIFFFKQKTAYEIKECDWSSDVCSSDLRIPEEILRHYGVKNKNINIYSKLEWENPSSSIKARAAFYMIMDGINRGKLTPETTLIEASSGNTGAGESLIGQVLGYNVEIIVPKGTSKEKTKKSTDSGAKIIYSPRERGTDGAQVMVNELLAEYPDKYFNPNQYDNQANIEAHILTTGPEIINQLRNIRSEERRVGKECRSRWSPYH